MNEQAFSFSSAASKAPPRSPEVFLQLAVQALGQRLFTGNTPLRPDVQQCLKASGVGAVLLALNEAAQGGKWAVRLPLEKAKLQAALEASVPALGALDKMTAPSAQAIREALSGITEPQDLVEYTARQKTR